VTDPWLDNDADTARRRCPLCGAKRRAKSLYTHLSGDHCVRGPEMEHRWPDLHAWMCEAARDSQRAWRAEHVHAVEDTITCEICGRRLHQLVAHLKSIHGVDGDEYRERYPGAPLTSPHRDAISADYWLDHYGKPYWTRARIVAAIRRWAKRTGHPPSASMWSQAARPSAGPGDFSRSRPTSMTVTTVFGTWSAAVRAAGYEPGRRPHRKRCISGLHEMTPENVLVRADGGRQCLACKRIADSKRYGGPGPTVRRATS
jgi:hypothetical protein